MPTISNRGVHMPPSPIRKLVPFADAAKAKGIKVYHLNIGQPDIETPKMVLDAVRNSDIKVLEYSHSAGFLSYRKKLVAYYAQFGISLTPDEILVTTGGSEAILFAIMSCLDPGDEIIIPEPFYANYNSFAIASQAKVVPVTSYIENDFKLPPIEEFEKKITSKTKAIMICNPNNPTGYVYSAAEMNTLRDICLKYNLFLFSDEAYREFCYDDNVHISAMTLEGLENNVILLDTISKRYSACGGRLGAFITKNKEVYEAALKFAQARLSPPTFAQIAGEAAVDLPKDYFNEIKKEYELRKNTLVTRLQKMDGVVCPMPKGAFYAIAKLPVEDAEDFCKWLLSSFSYQNQTIMMAPAAGFYSSSLGKNEVRFAYVLNTDDINNAMDCLEHGLKEYQKQKA
ncbi:MAG: pyridoxal phosphate-dependent aminotransferase [Chitinophagaceae bacterium]